MKKQIFEFIFWFFEELIRASKYLFVFLEIEGSMIQRSMKITILYAFPTKSCSIITSVDYFVAFNLDPLS